MKKLLIVFLSLTINCQAQNYFNKRMDFFNSWGDYGWSLYADTNHFWFSFATLPNGGLSAPWAVGLGKMNYNGILLDTTFIHIPYVNLYAGGPNSLNKTSNGFIIGGSYEDSTGNFDSMLMRFDNNGDTEWTKTFGDTSFQSGWKAIQCSDGNFLLCGQTAATAVYPWVDAMLLKTDTLGNLIWQQTYGEPNSQYLAFAVIETPNRGFALVGEKLYQVPTPWSPERDVWIALTDSFGNLMWDTTLTNTYFDRAWSIIATQDGNIVTAGYRGWEPQSWHPFFLKLDLLGNVIWEKQYLDGYADIEVHSIRELSDGSLIAAGSHDIPPFPPAEGFLMKLGSNGDSLWYHEYFLGPNSSHRLEDVYPTPDGGFIACGVIRVQFPDTGNRDIWILKVDSMGCEIANCTVGLNDFIPKIKAPEIFPNPFREELSLAAEDEIALLIIYDAMGKEILKTEPKAKHASIKTSSLPPGMYFIHCYAGKESFTRKMVKTD